MPDACWPDLEPVKVLGRSGLRLERTLCHAMTLTRARLGPLWQCDKDAIIGMNTIYFILLIQTSAKGECMWPPPRSR